MISRAADADEMTSVGRLPKWRSMTGPCFLAMDRRLWCGNELSWWRFPRIGSFLGDGGEFLFPGIFLNNLATKQMQNIDIRDWKKRGCSKMLSIVL